MKKKEAKALLPIIEEYAEAMSQKDWENDQGWGVAVDKAEQLYDKARAQLFSALGLKDKEKG